MAKGTMTHFQIKEIQMQAQQALVINVMGPSPSAEFQKALATFAEAAGALASFH